MTEWQAAAPATPELSSRARRLLLALPLRRWQSAQAGAHAAGLTTRDTRLAADELADLGLVHVISWPAVQVSETGQRVRAELEAEGTAP